jgi:hypothetical protein
MNLNYKPNVLKKSYKWEHILKETLFNVLQEVNTVEKIVHYENSDFEKNKVGVENAEQELRKIFESLAQQSCKFIRCFKRKRFLTIFSTVFTSYTLTNVNLIFAILTIGLYSQQHWAKILDQELI